MKCIECAVIVCYLLSHPARGEWIEITVPLSINTLSASHPARGEWIEILLYLAPRDLALSHPARGEWIEIIRSSTVTPNTSVSPREG